MGKQLLVLCYDADYTIGAMLKEEATTKKETIDHLKVTKSLITHVIPKLHHFAYCSPVYTANLNFVCRRKQSTE
jgi:hypothetical protein